MPSQHSSNTQTFFFFQISIPSHWSPSALGWPCLFWDNQDNDLEMEMWHNLVKETQVLVVWVIWEWNFFFFWKELPGEGSSPWNSMVSKCKAWNFCSHFGTMKGANLGVKLEPWKAEQKERGKQVPEGERHCWTSDPNQPCFGSPQHCSFQLCEPINPLYFSSQFELGFSFLATEGRFGWLFVNCHRNLEGKKNNTLMSAYYQIKTHYEGHRAAWQCFKWPSSLPDRGDRLC